MDKEKEILQIFGTMPLTPLLIQTTVHGHVNSKLIFRNYFKTNVVQRIIVMTESYIF